MTQSNLIVSIVSYFSKISKKRLETYFAILTSLGYDKQDEVNIDKILNTQLKDLGIVTVEDLLEAGSIPGDVQRQIRTVVSNRQLIKRVPEEQEIFYKLNDEEKKITCQRNLFKTQEDRDSFVNSKKNKCEMCSSEDNRMAIDHWRAHSVYNIDDEKIAVLLCETCNNIHHNVDASKILIKKKEDISIINNWISIETRIRESGFYPNTDDLSSQVKNISEVTRYIIENFGKDSKLEHRLNTLCTLEQCA